MAAATGQQTRWPPPPVADFCHGDIWLVYLHPSDSRRMNRTAAEVFAAPPAPREVFILLTSPWPTWRGSTAGYYRSRIVVGDRSSRRDEDIAADFHRLMAQTPPVRRNWSGGFCEVTENKQRYRLVWSHVVGNARL